MLINYKNYTRILSQYNEIKKRTREILIKTERSLDLYLYPLFFHQKKEKP